MTRSTRLGVLALALCCSCFVSRETVNVPISPEQVAQLEPGKTTANDVAELLGAPSEVVQLGFRSAWRYDHVREKRAGFTVIVVTLMDNDARMDRVWVFFDENELLTNVGSTFEAGGAQYQMPWQERSYDESAEGTTEVDTAPDAEDEVQTPADSDGAAAQ